MGRLKKPSNWQPAATYSKFFEMVPGVINPRPSSSKNYAATFHKHFWGQCPDKCWLRGKLVDESGNRIKNAVLRRCSGKQVIFMSDKAKKMLLSGKKMMFSVKEVAI